MNTNKKSWDDVSIAQAEELIEVAKVDEHPYANRIRQYAFIMDRDFDELYDMPTKQVEKLIEPYIFIEDPIFTRKTKEWDGFDICLDIRDATAAQAVDIDELSRSGEVKTLADFMAILCKREDMKDYAQRRDYLHHNMPVTIARGVYDFFLRRTNLWYKLFPKYLAWNLMKMRAKKQMMLLTGRLNRSLGGLFGSKS